MDEPRFAVDRMLEKLGAYLRVLGYDACSGERELDTRERIRRADAEGRVFLTRNTRIPDQLPEPQRMLRVRSEDPVLQLGEVVAALGLSRRRRLFTRCIRCNRELVELAELGALAARVPAAVRARHRRFWQCPACGTVFWRGTHVANTCQKLGIEEP
jgi:hypothetical protein